MTMKHKSPGDGWIAEIHSHLHTGIRALARPEGNLNGVAKVLIGDGLPIHFKQHEVDLMDVKIVGLKRVVFDGPIFDSSHLRGDRGLFIRVEHPLGLSVYRYIELNRTIGSAKLLGEVKIALRCWRYVLKSRKFERSHRCRRRNGFSGFWRLFL